MFERDADGVCPNPHGEVVLAAARDITRRYDQLRAEAPRVRVVLRQEPGHEMLQDLASGLSELALTAPRPPGPHDWLPRQRQRLVLAVPAGHRLAARHQLASRSRPIVTAEHTPVSRRPSG